MNVPAQESQLAFYARMVCERSAELLCLSRQVVADAYFGRAPFIDALTDKGFVVTTCLRKNVRLRFLHHGPQCKIKGRRKTVNLYASPTPIYLAPRCCTWMGAASGSSSSTAMPSNTPA